MKKVTLLLTFVLICFLQFNQSYAQISSTSDYLVAQPITDRLVPFNIDDTGDSFPFFKFGYDTAWDWDRNVIKASRFMEKPYIDVVRVSYQPEQEDLVNGDLSQSQIDKLNWRLSLVNNYANPGREIVMNVAAENVNTGPYYQNPTKWKDLVKATAIRIENEGHTVVSVGPMNEPDYSTHQGDIDDFKNIVTAMRADAYFDDIRISAGNTLNCDPNPAQVWYNYMLPAGSDEGNVHQLAGGFDGFASFYELVKGNGHFGADDEMHNIVEAMVSQEYGAEMGIWWGEAEFARGELGRSMNHPRIGYAEHRPNWTAAAVYKVSDNNAKAFGGTSERQAIPTTYNYVSKDKVVYFDGQGPMRDFVVELPGDPQGDYWDEQTNAERVINVTWGEDVQPYLVGRFVIVNRNSGKVLEVAGGSNNNGANIQQNTYSGQTYQQWDVTRVDSRIGGDFSYYRIQPVSGGGNKSIDLNNFSLSDGENIHSWDNGTGKNQQWYMEYQGDSWFNIRCRESALSVDVYNASMADGANVVQWQYGGGLNQQWRFVPVANANASAYDTSKPSVPSNLVVTNYSTYNHLSWNANSESDVAGYTIFRAETGGTYNTIARNVTTTEFIDNTALVGVTYNYKIKAIDNWLNQSDYSNIDSATVTGANGLVCKYDFESNTSDSSNNLNHSVPYGGVLYTTGHEGQSVNLSNKFLQLPPDIANHEEITIATWFNWSIKSNWQRIFDFGNGEDEYMFLTPRNASNQMQFTIKHNGVEQTLTAAVLNSSEWVHVAVTLGANGISLYVNGTEVGHLTTAVINPLDFKPVLNYIGRSQYKTDPLIYGRIDDFRIYNYELIPNQVASLHAGTLSVNDVESENSISVWPIPTIDKINIKIKSTVMSGNSAITVFDLNGRPLINRSIKNSLETIIDVSNLATGMYILKFDNDTKSVIKKFIVKH